MSINKDGAVFVKIYQPEIRFQVKGRKRIGEVVAREGKFLRSDSVMWRTYAKWHGLTEEETDSLIVAKNTYMRIMTLTEKEAYEADKKQSKRVVRETKDFYPNDKKRTRSTTQND